MLYIKQLNISDNPKAYSVISMTCPDQTKYSTFAFCSPFQLYYFSTQIFHTLNTVYSAKAFSCMQNIRLNQGNNCSYISSFTIDLTNQSSLSPISCKELNTRSMDVISGASDGLTGAITRFNVNTTVVRLILNIKGRLNGFHVGQVSVIIALSISRGYL